MSSYRELSSHYTLKLQYRQQAKTQGLLTTVREIMRELPIYKKSEFTKEFLFNHLFSRDKDFVEIFDFVKLRKHIGRLLVTIYSGKGTLNYARTLDELSELSKWTEDLIYDIIKELCVDEKEINIYRKRFDQHRQLYKDVMNIDPSSYFSYDKEEDIYFYLPKYDVYVSTNHPIENYDAFAQNEYPIIMTEEFYEHNTKASLSVDSYYYSDDKFDLLLKNIEHASIGGNFIDWSKEKVQELTIYSYSPVPSDMNIKEELVCSEKLLLSDHYSYLFRVRNNEYILFDDIRKTAIKCKDVKEAYNLLYPTKQIQNS